MNLTDLNNLIALGEGFTSEFKRSGTSNLGREICAFANATGGVILIGVTDAGEITGVNDHNRLKSEIQATARSADPPIAVEVESIGDVLCIKVPAQNSKPYSFGGKFFIREGASSQQLSRDEIREFFYKEGLIHFDETPCDGFSIAEDLTDEVWALFRRRARIPEHMDPATALTNLHLIGLDGRMTHAGAWLLASDIQKFSISADAACALFMGTDKVRILDRRGFNRDVYSMIDDVVNYILSKINIEYIIKHVKREERPELPEEALREAVVNALAHRDYRSTGNVQIYIFKDRVEIVSPGGLPAGMTEADLGVKSIPRNPLLFGMLHRMEAVEHIGSGIKRILGLCRDYGTPEPKIEATEHWFTVTFPRPVQNGVDHPASKTEAADDDVGEAAELGTTSVPSLSQVCPKSVPSHIAALIIQAAESPADLLKLMALTQHTNRTRFRRTVIRPLIDADLLEPTIPDKPQSSKQQYRLSSLGRKMLKQLNGNSS